MAACFLYWNFRENDDKPLSHERVSDKGLKWIEIKCI